MDTTDLIPVASLEKAWARLSANPDYQRSVTLFFKAPTFYLECPGLFAGTCKATGRRAIYCDQACSERLSRKLAARVGALLESQATPAVPSTACVDDAQTLNLQSEVEVKALFKEFKKADRYQKQCRQLAVAQALFANARRWTAPFHAPAVAAAAAATACAGCSAGPTSHGSGLADATAAAARLLSYGGRSSCGGGQEGTRTAGAISGCPMPQATLTSHPLSWAAVWGSDEDGDAGCGVGRTGGAGAHAPEQGAGFGAAAPATEAGGSQHSEAAAAANDAAEPLPELRNTAGADPWVSLRTSMPQPPDASAPGGSGCSSMGPSSAASPCWPPATPRCALVPEGGAASAAARATPDGDLNSDSCVPGPSWRCDGAAVTSAGCDAAAGGGCAAGAAGLVVCCSVDLEWWERDNTRVTEIGWTMWDNLTRRLESKHHIVAENERLVNRVYVPDHKHGFLFGRSSSGSLAEGATSLRADMEHYGEHVWAQWWADQQPQQQPPQQQPQEEQEGGPAAAIGSGHRSVAPSPPAAAGTASSNPSHPDAESLSIPPTPRMQLVVVGHGLSQDLKALSSYLGLELPPGAAVLDTADLAWVALGGGVGQERTAMSLRVLLKTLAIQATKLHNGGNDARYTMEAMLALTALNPSSTSQ